MLLAVQHDTPVKLHAPLRACYKQFMPNPPEPSISSKAALIAIRFLVTLLVPMLEARKQRARDGTPVVKSGPAFAHDRRFYSFSLTPRQIRHCVEMAVNYVSIFANHPKHLTRRPDAQMEETTDILRNLADSADDLGNLMGNYEVKDKFVRKSVAMYKKAHNNMTAVKKPEDRVPAREWLDEFYPNRGNWWYPVWRARQVYLGYIEPRPPPPETEVEKERREAREREAQRRKARQSPAHKWMVDVLKSDAARGSWPTHNAITGLPFDDRAFGRTRDAAGAAALAAKAAEPPASRRSAEQEQWDRAKMRENLERHKAAREATHAAAAAAANWAEDDDVDMSVGSVLSHYEKLQAAKLQAAIVDDVDEMRDLQTALSNDAQVCIHLHTNEDNNEQCSPAGKRKADNAADNAAGSSADHAKRRRRVTVAADA